MRAEGRATPAATAIAVATGIIAAVAVVYVLHWARSFLVPIAFGVVLSFAFDPLVRLWARYRVPRYASATLVVLALWGAGGTLIWLVEDDVAEVVARAPLAAERFARAIDTWQRDGTSSMQQLREAAKTLERAANEAEKAQGEAPVGARAARPPPTVRVEVPSWKWSDWVWTGSAGLAVLAGQLITVTFLILFLLGAGETLKRKLVRFAGQSLQRRKNALRMVDVIALQIQSSLVVLLATNVLFGVAVWLGFEWFGLASATVWGAAAGLAHFIPYFGAAVVAIAAGIGAWMDLGSWTIALGAVAWVIVLSTLIGMVVQTWMQSRVAAMDPAAIFIGLLFWGWVWGVPGLLIAMPLTAIFKAICDHVSVLRPVAFLLAALPPRDVEARLRARAREAERALQRARRMRRPRVT